MHDSRYQINLGNLIDPRGGKCGTPGGNRDYLGTSEPELILLFEGVFWPTSLNKPPNPYGQLVVGIMCYAMWRLCIRYGVHATGRTFLILPTRNFKWR
jgi:hypothetical protein